MTDFVYIESERHHTKTSVLLEIAYQLKRIADKFEEKEE